MKLWNHFSHHSFCLFLYKLPCIFKKTIPQIITKQNKVIPKAIMMKKYWDKISAEKARNNDHRYNCWGNPGRFSYHSLKEKTGMELREFEKAKGGFVPEKEWLKKKERKKRNCRDLELWDPYIPSPISANSWRRMNWSEFLQKVMGEGWKWRIFRWIFSMWGFQGSWV